MRRIGVLSVLLAAIGFAAAAEPHRDLSWSYFARETEAGRDNDIARFTYGQTEAGARFALSAAFRNEPARTATQNQSRLFKSIISFSKSNDTKSRIYLTILQY